MIHILCAIRDSAAGSYSPPFVVPAKGAAIRLFGDEVTKPDSPMGRHPEHYELFGLGVYDDSDGSFALDKSPVSFALAVDYVKGGINGSVSSKER